MQKIKNTFYLSIFLLLASLLFGQMVRIPIMGKIVLVSDIAVIIFLIFHFCHPEEEERRRGISLISAVESRKSIKSKVESHYLFLPIVFFVFFSILSLLFAIPSLGLAKVITAGLYLLRWILYAGVVFSVASLSDKEKMQRTVFWGIIGMGFLLSIAGFIQLKIHPDFADMVKFGWDPHKGRLLSTWYDPNLLAGYFIVVLAFLSAKIVEILNFKFPVSPSQGGQILKKYQISNIKYQITLLIVYLAMILTYSRSGYLALAAVFLTICFLKFNWKFFLAGLIIAPLTLALFPRSYSRVSDAAAVDITSQMRIDSWQDGWSVIKKNPVFGAGFNTLQWQWGKNRPEHASSGCDSSLLTIWAATGIFGLLSYAWIIWAILKNKYAAFKSSDPSEFSGIFALGSIAAIFGLLVHSCFVNSLLYPHILAVFWMISV